MPRKHEGEPDKKPTWKKPKGVMFRALAAGDEVARVVRRQDEMRHRLKKFEKDRRTFKYNPSQEGQN